MIKCTILIPTEHEGISFPDGKAASYIKGIVDLCGGCTIDSVTHGFYTMLSGKVARDRCVKVWAICDLGDLPSLRQIAAKIAEDFRQETVYLEWENVNIEFIVPQGVCG